MSETKEIIERFERLRSSFEFARAENLSPELQKECGMKLGMVVVKKTFNPHPKITVYGIKNGDFIGFLINKIIDRGFKDSLRNPFKD